MKHGVYVRQKVTINTDPQRRCYDGCNFSEVTRWSAWGLVCAYSDLEIACDSADVFGRINPAREYKIEAVQS